MIFKFSHEFIYFNNNLYKENAALVDELEEVQVNIMIRKEERKYLLRKLCEYEPQVALEVQNCAKDGPIPRPNNNTTGSSSNDHTKKSRKKHLESSGKLI